MSEVEERLKPTLVPMIEGQSRELDAIEQLDLGLWATMKAYVFDSHMDESFVTQVERDVVMDEKRPPANVRVFLASYGPAGTFGVDRWHAKGYRRKGDTEPEAAHATTLILNHLVIQVLGATKTEYRAFEEHGVVTNWMRTIVPPIFAGADWPPKTPLDEDGLRDFGATHFAFPDQGES